MSVALTLLPAVLQNRAGGFGARPNSCGLPFLRLTRPGSAVTLYVRLLRSENRI